MTKLTFSRVTPKQLAKLCGFVQSSPDGSTNKELPKILKGPPKNWEVRLSTESDNDATRPIVVIRSAKQYRPGYFKVVCSVLDAFAIYDLKESETDGYYRVPRRIVSKIFNCLDVF